MKPLIAYNPDFSRHVTPLGHPERPARTEAVWQALLPLALKTVPKRTATLEEIALAHSEKYIHLVQNEVSALKVPLAYLSTGDVTICPDSFEVALLAAGSCLAGVDAIMNEESTSCFANVRPPGHHATYSKGMGFCLFNNVSVACRYLQKKYKISRVAIIDWDVHHGNGTQDIFYEDPSVFYFSTHQAGIYPGSGWEEERGVGNIMNCPVACGLGSREAIFAAFTEKLVPAMKVFHPEFFIISAGFDAHQDDPIGGLTLTETDFAALTKIVVQMAKEHAQGRILSVLEGGYNLQALAKSALTHVKSLFE